MSEHSEWPDHTEWPYHDGSTENPRSPDNPHSPGNHAPARAISERALPQEVREIPIGLRRAGAWSWRILLVVAVIALVLLGISQIMVLVVPVLVALLFTALLNPVVSFLHRKTPMGRGVSAALTLVGLLVAVAGMLGIAGRQLFGQYETIQAQAVDGFQRVTAWITSSLGVKVPTLDSALDDLIDQVQAHSGMIASGALSGVSSVGNVLTGMLISLFTLFFLLAGGAAVWQWVVSLLPPAARESTDTAFGRGWKALSAYMRTQVLVAAVDATGIALGMVGVSMAAYAVPIWLIVFVFSFVPMIGAIVSGAIAVLLVLVLKGWVLALVMLGIVILVQQLESNFLQPLIMGKAVALHPLAVFLGVTFGTLTAGIAGALFAIPLIAFVNATALSLTGRTPAPEAAKPVPEVPEDNAPPADADSADASDPD